MKTTSRRAKGSRLLAAATLAVVCAAASPALADDEGVARFERGVQLYEAENYEGALLEFNAAYKLTSNYKILFNIGVCANTLKDYPAALDAFTKYLAEGGSSLPEARRRDVEERLAKLSLMVTRVRVTTNAPPGTTLTVDDQSFVTPLPEWIPIKVGRRQFSISANGKTATKSVDVASGGGPLTVNLTLSETPPQHEVPPPPSHHADTTPPPPVARTEPSFPWPWWALTAVLGGAAGVTGYLAVDARNDFGEKRATFGTSKTDLDDARDKTRTLSIVTDSILGATILSAGISTYFTIRYFGKKSSGSASLTISPAGFGYARSF